MTPTINTPQEIADAIDANGAAFWLNAISWEQFEARQFELWNRAMELRCGSEVLALLPVGKFPQSTP